MAYSTISKPGLHFNTKLYTGNGGTQSITGVGFQPDMIWCKARSYNDDHTITDAVRGNTKVVYPNGPAVEGTSSVRVTAFGTDGFTLGNSGDVNSNSATYVAWNWKANGAGSSNTDGTITATVSANTAAGMSIATWTGTGSNGSVGHGLSGVDCMIIKDLSNSRDFYFWSKTMVYNTRLEFNNTEAFTTGTDNMTALPDATKINMAVSTQNNGSGNNYVGYFFQEKKGYSKFGTYTGNGNADGTFVYTGFKPAFVLVKRTSGTESWQMTDSVRDKAVSPNFARLRVSSNGAEDTNTTWAKIEKFSNGFKLGGTDTVSNGSGSTYIYMAFAEEPLVANVGQGIPATAR